MRKLILAAALTASLLPATAIAQSHGEVRRDRWEAYHDAHNLRRDRWQTYHDAHNLGRDRWQTYHDVHDLRRAQAYGDHRGVIDARHDLRADRHETFADWHDYRRVHPEVFHGPAYVGPHAGWAYRPVAVGTRFDPIYYGQRYWIDPIRYRLPPIAGFQRYVRYGNDVALVNMRSGRVVAVYGGFFL